MHLTVNKDGLDFLRAFGLAALALLLVALRFSPLPKEFFGGLIERVLNGLPHPSKIKESRRVRLERQRKRRIEFDWFAGLWLVYVGADWFLIPQPYRLSDERRWPIAVSVFLAGTLVIFIGSQVWNGVVAWKKSSFWTSMVIVVVGELWLVRMLQPLHPPGFLFVLAVGGILFLWVFGLLLRAEQGETALRQIDIPSNQAETGRNK